jgi:uncharacterized protein
MADRYVSRELEASLKMRLDEGKRVLILYGARRVGKTTLVRHLLAQSGLRFLKLSGDDRNVAEGLSSRDTQRLLGMVSGYDAVFIDEAQLVPEIGLGLKIIHDAQPSLRLIVSGSSALDLASKTKESLAGRAWSFVLSPFSAMELSAEMNRFELERRLETDLVYGSYPEVAAAVSDAERETVLKELYSSYLFKDILAIGGIRQPRKIVDLLRLLAYQVGREVSFSELGTALGMSKDTVASYVDLLEKSFVLFRLEGWSRNLRSEVTRSPKIYFVDNGVRNMAVSEFRHFSLRNDQGQLWENYIVSERRKRLEAQGAGAGAGVSSRFWRLKTGAEIDYVEEGGGKLRAWEIKLSPSAKAKVPKSWAEAYPEAAWDRVDRANYLDFIAAPRGTQVYGGLS